MSTDPDQIREDIERTRAELSSDVDALTDKVSPSQVAQRQADKVRSAVTDVKDRVMGGVSTAPTPQATRPRTSVTPPRSSRTPPRTRPGATRSPPVWSRSARAG